MRLRYQHLWTKQIGDARADIEASMREWADVLKSITPNEMVHGLDTWDSEYPPNVYQFKAVCKSLRRTGAHKTFKALPKPKADLSIVRKSIKEIRQKL